MYYKPYKFDFDFGHFLTLLFGSLILFGGGSGKIKEADLPAIIVIWIGWAAMKFLWRHNEEF